VEEVATIESNQIPTAFTFSIIIFLFKVSSEVHEMADRWAMLALLVVLALLVAVVVALVVDARSGTFDVSVVSDIASSYDGSPDCSPSSEPFMS
jgi:hypothetical protein